MQQFGASMFYMVVHRHKLSEMETSAPYMILSF